MSEENNGQSARSGASKNRQFVFLGTHDIFKGVFDSHNIRFFQRFLDTYAQHIDDVVVTVYIPPKLTEAQRRIVDEKVARFSEVAKAHGCTFRFIPFQRGLPTDILTDAGRVEPFLRDNAIVLCQNYFAGRIGLRLKRRHPSVHLHLDLKGVSPEEELYYGTGVWPRRFANYAFLKWFEPAIVGNADSISYVSEAFRKHINKHYRVRGRQFIYPSVVDPSRFFRDAALRREWRHKLGVLPHQRLVLFSGSIKPGWAMADTLFQLFARFESFGARGLLLTFDVEKGERLREKYGLKTLIVRSAQGQELNGCYNAVDVGFMTRERGVVSDVSSPTKVAEYLLTGSGVILHEGIGDYSEMLRGKPYGLVKPDVAGLLSITKEEFDALGKPGEKDLHLIGQEVSADVNIRKYAFLFE